ncbi:hypothetical protein EVB27_037 [Rhizobium phage RHph_TM16]|nr:hypothetical protein EVB27_037 [Rhizobium phage RHph_TM16]
MLSFEREQTALRYRLAVLKERKDRVFPSSVEAIEISNRIKAVQSTLEVLDDMQRPENIRLV